MCLEQLLIEAFRIAWNRNGKTCTRRVEVQGSKVRPVSVCDSGAAKRAIIREEYARGSGIQRLSPALDHEDAIVR